MKRLPIIVSTILNDGVSDTTAPTITITSTASLFVVGAFTVTFTLSEVSTDFAVGDITCSANAGVGTFAGSGTSYTAVITPTEAGSVTVDVAAGAFHDAAGNGNTAATQFSILYVNPVVYVDASDITTLYQDTGFTTPATADGQTVWAKDKSGNNIHFSAGNGLVYKVNIQNGLSVLRGDGTAGFLKTASRDWGIASGASFTEVMVFVRRSTGATYKAFSSFATYSPEWIVAGDAGKHSMYWPGGSGGPFGSIFANNGDYIVDKHRAATTNVFTAYVNGSLEAGSYNGPAVGIGTTTLQLLAEAGVGGGYAQVDLCAYMLFVPSPSAEIMTALRTALNTKWAVF